MSEISEKFDYKKLVDHFGDRIETHCAYMSEQLALFIKRNGYDEKVNVADSVLFQAIVDYFTDIYRLKTFHGIDKVNAHKIHAYTAYWILRRKPIQIQIDNISDPDLPFLNERFVCSYIVSYLRGNYSDLILSDSDYHNFDSFIKNLEYFLTYRIVTPQMIETMIESFMAGMAFQHTIDTKRSTTLL